MPKTNKAGSVDAEHPVRDTKDEIEEVRMEEERRRSRGCCNTQRPSLGELDRSPDCLPD